MPEPLDSLRLPIVPVQPRREFADELRRRITGGPTPIAHRPPTVRYFVDDLEAAVAFYCDDLDFEEELRSAPAFAMLYRGDLRLLLSVPSGPGGGHSLPDGSVPEPGGWNRMSLQVADLSAAVERLRGRGVRVRGEIATGAGVRLALLLDPAGNPVELFEPLTGYHERAR